MVGVIVMNDGHVDFESPIHMSDVQAKEFVKFMKSMFPTMITVEVQEPPKYVGNREKKFKHWEVDEYALLLSPYDNETIATKTKRTVMSVIMKRGEFPPEFMVWAKRKGYAYSPNAVNKKIIEEFMKEKGDLK